MKLFDWVAATALFFHLPVPVYWLILHTGIGFWRRHVRAAFWVAGLAAWSSAAIFLYAFHERLFRSERAPAWAIGLGLILVAADVYVLSRVKRELGGSRLVGHTEVRGGGELATGGLYARIRHPRYAAMMLSVLGACLMAGTLLLWAVAAAWWVLVLVAIGLEERELRARFGAAYAAYSRRVPRFLPFRFWPGED